jgi:hypothetical protein
MKYQPEKAVRPDGVAKDVWETSNETQRKRIVKSFVREAKRKEKEKKWAK